MANEDAWQDIVGGRSRTLALLARWLGSPQRAEDVWQEAALRFGQARERGQFIECGPASTLTYFMKLLRNCCIDELRVATRRRTQPIDSAEPAVAAAPAQTTAEGQELRESVIRALDQLPPEWASAIQMVCFESLSIQDAAGRLRVKPALVSVWIYRGKLRLRALLQKQR